MNNRITESFLEGNLFETSKQVAGWPVYYYTEKGKYEICICPARGTITAVNYEKGDEISYGNRLYHGANCTKENLKKCLEFLKIKDEFDYNL